MMNAKSAFALCIQKAECKLCIRIVYLKTMNPNSVFALCVRKTECLPSSCVFKIILKANSAFFFLCFFFKGPAPSAITAVHINDNTQVLVIANGVVGGLYTYSVTTGPVVNFEGFLRRGQAGLTWNDAYARSDDAVGEPYITDLM